MKCVCCAHVCACVHYAEGHLQRPGRAELGIWRMKTRCLDLKLKKSSGGRSHRSHKGFSIYSNRNREILKSCN